MPIIKTLYLIYCILFLFNNKPRYLIYIENILYTNKRNKKLNIKYIIICKE